jgi:hypothetical protein
MRVLLVAYEFPPSPSPQSLRWAYLSSALAALGHDVHVLAPELAGQMAGLPALGPGVTLHRIPAGPLVGFTVRRMSQARSGAGPGGSGASSAPSTLNWKGRLFQAVKSAVGQVLFPDIRGEWTRGARRALRPLLARLDPDVVVTSHEPANTLLLGLAASGAGFPWVADLGDPVLAPYTPARWKWRSQALEAATWRQADAVTVTNEQTVRLLNERHGPPRGACTVLSQGFPGPSSQAVSAPQERIADLELLYTGSFYRFRDPAALVEAVLATPGVRLTIASMNVPDELADLARSAPGKVRLAGFLRHDETLALQRQADVLVNIGNLDPCQVPGKAFEYLGSGRPILHLGSGTDGVASLLAATGAGWACANSAEAIGSTLLRLRDARQAGTLAAELARDEGRIAEYRWDRIARRCADVLATAALARRPRTGAMAFQEQGDETQ